MAIYTSTNKNNYIVVAPKLIYNDKLYEVDGSDQEQLQCGNINSIPAETSGYLMEFIKNTYIENTNFNFEQNKEKIKSKKYHASAINNSLTKMNTELSWLSTREYSDRDLVPYTPNNFKYLKPLPEKLVGIYRRMTNPFFSLYCKILIKNIFLKWEYDEYLNRFLFNLLNTKLLRVSIGERKVSLYFEDDAHLIIIGSLTKRKGTPYINDIGYGSITKKGKIVYSWNKNRPCVFIMHYLLKLIYSANDRNIANED